MFALPSRPANFAHGNGSNTSFDGSARSSVGPADAGREGTLPLRIRPPQSGGVNAVPSGVIKPGEKPTGPGVLKQAASRAGPSGAVRPAAAPSIGGLEFVTRPVAPSTSIQPLREPALAKSNASATPLNARPTGLNRLPCTYAPCGRHFPTQREMNIHKIQEHDYCQRCDEDFPDEERLLLHKITSVRHIVCPVCGVEFRSTGGRDVHIRQNHRADQSIKCRGCPLTFKTASGLMQHVESNGCRRISQSRLIQQQQTRLMIAEVLDGDRHIHLEDLDDNDGGVMLDGTPTSPSPSPKAQMAIVTSPLRQQQNQEFPSPPSNATEKSMVTALSRPSTRNEAEAATAAGVDPAIVPDPIAITLEHDKTWELFGSLHATAGEILRKVTPGWDPSEFLNMTRTRYVCQCRVSYRRVEDFEEHVIEEMRNKKPLRCPSCFRNFKCSADLVAHMEAGSSGCSVAAGSAYGQVLDQLTGGVVRVAGQLHDGSIKYEAGNVEPLYEADTEPTLMGVDVSYANIMW